MDIDIMWSMFNKYRPMLDEMHTAWLVMPPYNKDVPFVEGAPMVGQTLSCTMGNWNHMQDEPHSYVYQWKRDGSDVAGVEETPNTYLVADADAGHVITCVVTATNEYGTTEAPPSNEIEIPAADGSTRSSRGAEKEEKEEDDDHRSGPPSPRRDNNQPQHHRRT
jgi:hypothetical protein